MSHTFKLVTLLFLALSLSSCRTDRSASGARAADNCDESVTVLYKRTWKDPDTFVIGKPSDSDISAWKEACESLNSQGNSFEVHISMSPLDSYLAFEDLDQVRYQNKEAGLADSFEFFCWRLNEMSPQGEIGGECERYAALERQIDSLLEYMPGEPYKMCNREWIWADFEKMRTSYYCGRLCHQMPELRTAIERENNAFESYWKAVNKSYEMILMGAPADWGSIATMDSGRFARLSASEHSVGIIPFFLGVSDPENAERPECHEEVTDAMIDHAYSVFRASIKDDREYYELMNRPFPEEYSQKNLRKVLDADHAAWNGWMKARSEFSSSLSGDCKELYDLCTNNAKRKHLITLLNRYRDCEALGESWREILLNRDCTDQEILDYNYDKAYNACIGL